MPRASTRVTPDVSPRCERYSSSHKQDRIGAPKNAAQTIITPTRTVLTSIAPRSIARMVMGRTRIVLTNTGPKNIVLMSTDRTWAVETAALHR